MFFGGLWLDDVRPVSIVGLAPDVGFVNTLDNCFSTNGVTELLTTYSDLVIFSEQSKIIDSFQCVALLKRAASRAINALHHAIALRECLASVFYKVSSKKSPSREALTDLASFYAEAEHQRTLVWNPARHATEEAGYATCKWPEAGANPLRPV